MMMIRRFKAQTTAAVGAMLIASTLPAAADPSLNGFWMDAHGEVVLEIEPCADAMCGKVVWLRLPNGPDGKALLDYRNPDESLRSRPVCGLRVLSGMKKLEDGTFGGGRVYVSDLGMEFKGNAKQLDNDRMEVRGYIGISLFGQTEVWKRVAGPPEHCQRPKPQQQPAAIAPKPPAPAPQAEAPVKDVAVPVEAAAPKSADVPKATPAAPPLNSKPKPEPSKKVAAPPQTPVKPATAAKPAKPVKPDAPPWDTTTKQTTPEAQQPQ